MGCRVLQFECLSIKILARDPGKKKEREWEKEEGNQFCFKRYYWDDGEDSSGKQATMISFNIIPFLFVFINIIILVPWVLTG